jgi:hypothetical protein
MRIGPLEMVMCLVPILLLVVVGGGLYLIIRSAVRDGTKDSAKKDEPS